ncbi:MAG: L-threonylcarbamoyladenylate synthase [Salinigranum sp.]
MGESDRSTNGSTDGATGGTADGATADGATAEDVARAAAAIRDGGAVVYPTETVYGLGADATDDESVERVYELKRRPREKPLSVAVPDVETALDYTRPTDRAVRFMREFLPGPVTVVVERRETLADGLTAGRDRVGVRVPDHALALELLAETPPITATSANVSGEPSVTDLDDLDERVRTGVAVVLDGGTTPGGGSTVVDPERGVVHRRGALADEVEAWLEAHG